MLVNIFGKRGAGKTHMIKRALLKCEPPVVVLDVLGNFHDIPGTYQTESLPDALQKIKEYNEQQSMDEYQRGLTEEIPPVIVLQPMDASEAVDFVSALMWHEWGGTLVIDEADAFDIHQAPHFDYLIRYGRNHGVHILTGCRRPAEISRNITAGANALYIFQTQEPRDIEYFAKTLLGKQQAERLKNLPEFHGLFINYDKKTIGIFKTDQKGDVFILEEKNINGNEPVKLQE